MWSGTYCRLHIQPAPPQNILSHFNGTFLYAQTLRSPACSRLKAPLPIEFYKSSELAHTVRPNAPTVRKQAPTSSESTTESYSATSEANRSSCIGIQPVPPIQDLSRLMSIVYSCKDSSIESRLQLWCLPERRRPSPVAYQPATLHPVSYSCGDFEV